MATDKCPICNRSDAQLSTIGPLNTTVDVTCPSCGTFLLDAAAAYEITQAIEKAKNARPILMHAVRKMQGPVQPRLTSNLIKRIVKERDLPTARAQADNLLLWTGDNTSPGIALPYDPSVLFPLVGAYHASAIGLLIENLHDDGFFSTSTASLLLSLKGWDRYWELKRGRSESKKAFMAMPYGNTEVDTALWRLKVN